MANYTGLTKRQFLEALGATAPSLRFLAMQSVGSFGDGSTLGPRCGCS